MRVPVIVRAPGATRAGQTCSVPITSTDFYPTLLELAGLPLAPRQHADGLSLVSLLKGGKTLDRNAIFWHYPHYHGSTWAPGAAVRSGKWKLIEFYEEGLAELYDLESDGSERRELSESHGRKKRELLDMLHAWQKKIGAGMPAPNPGFKPGTAHGKVRK